MPIPKWEETQPVEAPPSFDQTLPVEAAPAFDQTSEVTVKDEIRAAIPDIVSQLKASLQPGAEFSPQQLKMDAGRPEAIPGLESVINKYQPRPETTIGPDLGNQRPVEGPMEPQIRQATFKDEPMNQGAIRGPESKDFGLVKRAAKTATATAGQMLTGAGQFSQLYGRGYLELSKNLGDVEALNLVGNFFEKSGKEVAGVGKDITGAMAYGDPGNFEKVVGAFASGATFFIPGLGISKVAGALSYAPRIATAFGVSASTMMESALDAGLAREEAINRGLTPENADKVAMEIFKREIPVTYLGNKLGLFAKANTPIGKFAKAFIAEGTQEAGQQVVQNVAQGQQPGAGVKESFALGGLVGGVLGQFEGVGAQQQPPPTPPPFEATAPVPDPTVTATEAKAPEMFTLPLEAPVESMRPKTFEQRKAQLIDVAKKGIATGKRNNRADIVEQSSQLLKDLESGLKDSEIREDVALGTKTTILPDGTATQEEIAKFKGIAPTPTPTVQAEAPAIKEPWQMTKSEYIETRKADIPDFKDIEPDTQAEQIKSWGQEYQPGSWPREADVPASVLKELPAEQRAQVLKFNDKARQTWADSQAPWNQTYKQFLKETKKEGVVTGSVRDLHKSSVERALSEGKSVPPEVLKDYPELKPQTQEEARASFQKAVEKQLAPKLEPVKDIFTREEIEVSKPQVTRRKSGPGTSGRSITNISAPGKVLSSENWNQFPDTDMLHAYVSGNVDFKTGRVPLRKDPVWTAYAGRATDKTPKIIRAHVPYNEAIEISKDYVHYANPGRQAEFEARKAKIIAEKESRIKETEAKIARLENAQKTGTQIERGSQEKGTPQGEGSGVYLRNAAENRVETAAGEVSGPARDKSLPITGPVNQALREMDFPADAQVSKNLRLHHVVKLFGDLEGGIPEVVKRFRKPGVMGKAWDTGKIKLHSMLGQNEQMASLVLAHEISHVADALYGDTTKTYARGNILGRIGAMDKYVYDNLSKFVKTKAEIATEIKGIKSNYLEQARSQAGDLKGPERAKFVREKMQELAQKELSEKGYISKEEITKELVPLASWWNQSMTHPNKPEELYAEAMSVYLLSPKDVAKRAPKFYEAIQNWLAKKPEFEMAVKEMWATLEQAPDVSTGILYNQILKDAHEGEVARAAAEDSAVDTKHVMGRWAQMQRWYDYTLPLTDAMLQRGLTRSDSPFSEIQRYNHASVIAEAYATEIRDKVFVPLNNSKRLTPDILHAYLFTERVRRGNLEQDENGNVIVTVGDRSMKLNSRGVTPKSAQEIQDLVIKPAVGDEWPLLREIANNLYDQHQEILKRYGEGPFGKELNDKLKDNEFYVTFEPTKYLEGKGGGNAHTSKMIYTSVGDLGPIANTVVSTVLKDMQMISSLTQSIARQKFYEWGLAANNKSVVPAERKAGGFFDSPPPNYETVYWLWDGKVQAAHVHNDWLPIVKNDKGALEDFFGEMNAMLVPFKYAYVNLRAAFFFANIIKDTFATYSNLPEYKFFDPAQATEGLGMLRAFGALDALTRSLKELPAMVRNQMGKETSKAAQDAKWMGIGASHYAQELTAFAQGIERVLRKRGVYLPNAKYDSVGDKALGLLQFAVDVVNASDMATKVANFKMLKGLHPEMSDAWIADVVNTRVGTPDTTNKGVLTPLYNWVFMYSHVAMKGWQGSWRSFKENPKVFIPKMVGNAIIPRIVAYAALNGLIGRDDEERRNIKKIMRGVPEYFMAGSLVIPLGLTESGKSVFLTIPQDEATRTIGGMTYYTLKNMDPNSRDNLVNGVMKSISAGMDYAQNQTPGFNPLLRTANQLGQMWNLPKGEGPTGGFGQPLIPERIRNEYPVSKKRGWAYLGRDISNNTLGLGQFYKFSDNPDEIKSTVEKALGLPLIGDIVGRFLRVSASGAPGGAYEAKAEAAAKTAKTKNDLVDEINNLRDQFVSDNRREPTRADKMGFYRQIKQSPNRTMLNGVSPREFIKTFDNYTTAAGGRMGKMLSALKSGSNEGKAAVLLEYSKELTPVEMQQLIQEARRNKFISPKSVGQFRREQRAIP